MKVQQQENEAGREAILPSGAAAAAAAAGVDDGSFSTALSAVGAGVLIKKKTKTATAAASMYAPATAASSGVVRGLSAVLHGTQALARPEARTVSADVEARLTAVLRDNFGHAAFREGQAWAIDRVLIPFLRPLSVSLPVCLYACM